MANIGFSKLTLIGKIKLCLHLLGKSGNPRAGEYWQITFYDDMSGSIGYDWGGKWEREYPFQSEKELEEVLLSIYEKNKESAE